MERSTFAWTPSACESFSSQTTTRNVTPDCWETCDWSGNEEESDKGEDWGSCSEWSVHSESPKELAEDSSCYLSPQAASTPTMDRNVQFQFADSVPLQQSLSSSELSSLSPVRRSPRAVVPRRKFDPTRAVTNEDGWQLSSVMELQGCQPRCCSQVHGVSEYDVLIAHSSFASKSPADRRAWMLDYFDTNCPHNEQGEKDPKNIQYILCGRRVCQALWQAILSISTSTFYSLRRDFMDGKRADKNVRMRSLSSKSMEAVAWMSSYFTRVGDKRPDKDGIYLPSCLSEKSIYNLMVEDFAQSTPGQDHCVCLSQFNRLFRTYFPNVTIPKVCLPSILVCVYMGILNKRC